MSKHLFANVRLIEEACLSHFISTFIKIYSAFIFTSYNIYYVKLKFILYRVRGFYKYLCKVLLVIEYKVLY